MADEKPHLHPKPHRRVYGVHREGIAWVYQAYDIPVDVLERHVVQRKGPELREIVQTEIEMDIDRRIFKGLL